MGCGKPQPPLPPSRQNGSQGTLFTPLVAVALKMLGTIRLEQPKNYCRFLHPQFSPRATLVCTLPALPLLSAGTRGSCAAELWSGQKGSPIPCCPFACAEHQALLAAMPWWHSQVPDKICVKTICCFLQESEGSKWVCSWWCREKLSRLLRGILDHLRTLIFALLSEHAPDCIPELMLHFAWDLGRFTCCQVAKLTVWQSPVKQMGLTYFLTMHTI